MLMVMMMPMVVVKFGTNYHLVWLDCIQFEDERIVTIDFAYKIDVN